MSSLILKRASASRRSGEWSEDDYDVLADGVVVGRIMKPADASWLWTLAYGWFRCPRCPGRQAQVDNASEANYCVEVKRR
jgi:hypothetical protein